MLTLLWITSTSEVPAAVRFGKRIKSRTLFSDRRSHSSRSFFSEVHNSALESSCIPSTIDSSILVALDCNSLYLVSALKDKVLRYDREFPYQVHNKIRLEVVLLLLRTPSVLTFNMLPYRWKLWSENDIFCHHICFSQQAALKKAAKNVHPNIDALS